MFSAAQLPSLTSLNLGDQFPNPCPLGQATTTLGQHYCTLPDGCSFDGATLISCANFTGTELDLSASGIDGVAAGAFVALGSSVTQLKLNDNIALTSLPSDSVFASLTGLTHLYLHNTSLALLPGAAVFASNTALQLLYLYHTGLQSLPSGTIFAGLSALQDLRLDGNSLTEVPQSLLAGLGNLQYLHLNDNSLTSLPHGAFSDLGSLERLYLGDNGLTALPSSDVFGALSSLTTLQLHNNRLETWSTGADTFQAVTKLEVLTMHNVGNLVVVPNTLFAPLNETAIAASAFDLSGNNFTTPCSVGSATWFAAARFCALPTGCTHSGKTLLSCANVTTTELDLSHSNLDALAPGVFHGLSSVQVLNLSHAGLSTLDNGTDYNSNAV